jgi:TonB family protein
MRNDSLNVPLASSLLIHLVILALVSASVQNKRHRQEFQPIALVDLPSSLLPAQAKMVEATSEAQKAPPKPEKIKDTQSPAKTDMVKPEKALPAPAAATKDEITKPIDTKSTAVARTEASSVPLMARVEGGGSEAGAGNLVGKGDVGVAPGTGTASAGGGTAASGLGRRGSGAPGLPAQTVLRTNREAKPIQTVRATYPAMALRAGLESDVTLRIEVDPDGKVTTAEIIKSGGGGFDEEALKAVKQSRFEPAQRDGQNIPAEFTFIYRFRLQR